MVVLLPDRWGWAARWVGAWDAAVVVLLTRPWLAILRADADESRRRAVAEDPGGVAELVIAVVASAASFASTIVLLQDSVRYMPVAPRWLVIALGAGAIVGAWTLVHTAFALHYARLYLRLRGFGRGARFSRRSPE